MRPILVATLLLLPAGVLSGQSGPQDSVAVVRVLDEFQAALKAGDSLAVLRLLAPDAIILEAGGIESLTEYRSHHLPADIGFSRATERKPGPVRVRVAGAVAWAWSTAETTGTLQGQAVNSLGAELAVLTRTSSGWRLQAVHWSSRRRRP